MLARVLRIEQVPADLLRLLELAWLGVGAGAGVGVGVRGRGIALALALALTLTNGYVVLDPLLAALRLLRGLLAW